MKLIVLTLAVSTAALAQNTQRVYTFSSVSAPSSFAEVGNIFRTIADMKDITVNVQAKTVTAGGTASQIAILDWLAPRLDATSAAPGIYQVPGTADDVVQIVNASAAKNPAALQELVNIARTAADLNRVFPFNSSMAIVVRGSSDRAKMTEWAVQQLLSPPSASVAEYMLADDLSRLPSKRVHIYFLRKATAPIQIQEFVNVVRTAADLNRIFPFQQNPALVARGNDSQIELADWLVRSLDVPPPGTGMVSDHVQIVTPYPDPATEQRVFYFPAGTPSAALQKVVNQLRSDTGSPRVFPFSEAAAVVFRGNPTQAAKAEEVAREAQP